MLSDDPERDGIFEEVWDQTGRGEQITVPDPYLPHEFVQWLIQRDEYIFHGSGKTDIDVFEPRRESLELMNYHGGGNLGAVYGTHQGLWAMFFAVVDRGRLQGSIRNGVATYTSSITGEEVDLYQFSVSQASLPDRPFSAGALYVLPRETFDRIRLPGGGPYSNEWGSPVSVEPLGVIQLEPENSPFLDEIGGHDDGELIRLNELSGEVFGRVEGASRVDGGFRLTISPALDREVLDQWLELGQRFFPDMSRNLINDTTVELLGPPALIHTLEDQLGELLD